MAKGKAEANSKLSKSVSRK